MKVLITGSTGFVGGNLVDYLHNKGIVIVGLDRKRSVNKNLEQSFTWDEFSAESLGDITAIVHLAGKAHDTKNTSTPNEYFEINTALTKTLFDTFLESGVRDFIYFSSVKAVADTVDDILTEEACYEAQTPYGQSKEQAEKYLSSKNIGKEKRLFIMRPCMIHGPGNKGNLNLLYKFVLKGIPYPLAAFQNKRSFLSIDNLTYLVKKLLITPTIDGGVYNLADDEALSTNDVIKIVAKATGKRPKLWKVYPWMIKMMAKAGDVLHLPLNSERLKKLTESYVVSNSKIKAALNIYDFPLSSTDGLTKTIKSFS
jgi:nucleoside-diphosphate-sugar epimerase